MNSVQELTTHPRCGFSLSVISGAYNSVSIRRLLVPQRKLMTVDDHALPFQVPHSSNIFDACFIPSLRPSRTNRGLCILATRIA